MRAATACVRAPQCVSSGESCLGVCSDRARVEVASIDMFQRFVLPVSHAPISSLARLLTIAQAALACKEAALREVRRATGCLPQTLHAVCSRQALQTDRALLHMSTRRRMKRFCNTKLAALK
jgi:hypothetical protein